MIAIAVVTQVLGVGQTWLSNLVGQRVMHDLRTRVYEHLQRLSLAFFTRTRTGDVQSRIANDIGGVESVVTTTATSTASNLTTVIATVVAMFLLDWRLAVFALVLVPFFVLLTKRVGAAAQAHRRPAPAVDVRDLEPRPGVAVGLGDPARQDHGPRRPTWPTASAASPPTWPTSRCARAWPAAGSWAASRRPSPIMPALVYWFAGMGFGGATITIGTLVAFTTLQTRLFFPLGSLLQVQVDLQTSLALFERVFEYLDLPVEITERSGARTLDRAAITGEVAFDDVWFRYAPDGDWTIAGASFAVPRGTQDRDRGRDRLGQDHARLPARAPL